MPPKPGVYQDGFTFVEKTNISRIQIDDTSQVSVKNISYYSPYDSPKINPLVVLVDFSDTKFLEEQTTTYYENLLFSQTDKSLATFYKENSGGKLEIVNAGVYPLVLHNPYPMRAYGADISGSGSDSNPQDLALWVAEKLDTAGYDLSKFDSNNDSIVDALIVIHAGNAQEESGKSDDIWSFKDKIVLGTKSYYLTSSGYKLIDFIIISETSPLGTFCHEFGHILGLPDIYNTLTGKSNCSEWDLMDSGGWTDNGLTPSHLSAWCKTYLKWGNIKISDSKLADLKMTATEKLDDDENNVEFVKFYVLGNTKEYFLVEYRNQTGFDSKLPGKGSLIWHIDESLIESRMNLNKVNIGSPNNAVELIEKDETNAGLNRSQATDLFNAGDVFGYPLNKSFSGLNSSIILSNFSDDSSSMDFSSYVLKVADKFSVLKFFNYPNPTYGGKTTFKLEIDKPISQNVEFKIYDISGKLIYKRNISQSDSDFSDFRDYHFSYKFEWDCREIASGLYIYFVNLGNVIKTGKIAVLN
jgi:immune inhibitor A